MDSSRVLPSGVVTFLMTDIEGSTRLWETEPEAMHEALLRHDAVVNAYVRRLNGHVVKSKGEGDSVFAVFTHARDAVTTALVLQCAFADERWATSAPLRVRMGIHTGQIELRYRDYFGPTVNRCARLRGLGKGGQVLLSGVTAELIKGQLPPGASLKDLGTHQLKDLSSPERVWQLAHPRMTPGAARSSAAEAGAAKTTLRAYLLTDHLNRTADGRELFPGRTYTATGLSQSDQDGAIRCYTTVNVAALLNAVNERFRMPRVWEVTVDREPAPGAWMIECQEVTTLRQIELPALTGKHLAHFAVLCARAAYSGDLEGDFNDWALSWLGGGDNSGVKARELGAALAKEAHGDTLLAVPQELMLANAARAASHASKLSFLVGLARDEENKRAIECAASAIHTATRMTQVDVVALADQAVPKLTPLGPVAPIRSTATVSPNRILRALPT